MWKSKAVNFSWIIKVYSIVEFLILRVTHNILHWFWRELNSFLSTFRYLKEWTPLHLSMDVSKDGKFIVIVGSSAYLALYSTSEFKPISFK